jgi:nucleotide-binding universal stress UspA family protein
VKILVAYDGSDEAKRTLDWAAQLSRGTPGSSVTVIGVAPALAAAPHISDAVDPSSDVPLHRRQLDEAASILASAAIQAETIVRIGKPAEEILDAAEEGFDLVVLGHRGMGAARRFLMGSVSERVVRHAARPVLVVPQHVTDPSLLRPIATSGGQRSLGRSTAHQRPDRGDRLIHGPPRSFSAFSGTP